MARQNSDETIVKAGATEPARKRWAAPRLTVSTIGAATLAAAASTDDGASNLLS